VVYKHTAVRQVSQEHEPLVGINWSRPFPAFAAEHDGKAAAGRRSGCRQGQHAHHGQKPISGTIVVIMLLLTAATLMMIMMAITALV